MLLKMIVGIEVDIGPVRFEDPRHEQELLNDLIDVLNEAGNDGVHDEIDDRIQRYGPTDEKGNRFDDWNAPRLISFTRIPEADVMDEVVGGGLGRKGDVDDAD